MVQAGHSGHPGWGPSSGDLQRPSRAQVNVLNFIHFITRLQKLPGGALMHCQPPLTRALEAARVSEKTKQQLEGEQAALTYPECAARLSPARVVAASPRASKAIRPEPSALSHLP